MIKMIISGGQTGVDQAALDAAIKLEIPYGGTCPKGRIDENGIIPERFNQLDEIAGDFKTEKENYDARTKKNIDDSNGTLIIVPKIPLPDNIKDGTVLTIAEVQRQKKPHLLIDLSEPTSANTKKIVDWVKEHEIAILNIAGPRESNAKGINKLSFELLQLALPYVKNHSIRPRL
jgi:hypothetical protein